MVQLKILTGKKAGTIWVSRRFPVRIGRSPGIDLQLEEDGVWDQHFQLDFRPPDGFLLTSHPDARTSINDKLVQRTFLRNGDTIEIGAAKIDFSLSESVQGGLRFREWATWAAIAVISLAQIAVIYVLLR
jgi:pSer/pThr/pTyr-binding forkhead associated (FHA) protein